MSSGNRASRTPRAVHTSGSAAARVHPFRTHERTSMSERDSLVDARSGTLAFLRRTGGTFTGEARRQQGMTRRLEVEADAVGLIHRFDHDDVLTRTEAEHWDRNVLPFGWWIVSDSRRAQGRAGLGKGALTNALD